MSKKLIEELDNRILSGTDKKEAKINFLGFFGHEM